MADDPKRSQFIRCPMPPFANVSPDTLRNFYEPGVSQFRVFPPAAINGTPQKGAKGDPGKPGEAAPAPSTTIAPKSAAPKRETVSLTTGTLATNAQETGTVMLGKTFSLMQVNVSGPCRVRLYSNTDFRDADISSGRALVAPSAFTEHGIIADLVFKDNWHFAGSGSWSDSTYSGSYLVNNLYNNRSTWYVAPKTFDLWSWMFTCPAVGTAVRLQTGTSGNSNPYGDISAYFSNQPYANWSVWRAAGYPMGSSLGSLGSIPYNNSVNTGSSVLVPSGAQSIIIQTTVNNSDNYSETLNASMLGLSLILKTQTPAATVITPDPLTWVCSPEAPGSDCSAYPTGDIAYVIDNLYGWSTAVTANFTVLREEK